MKATSSERGILGLIGTLAVFLLAAALSPASATTVTGSSILPNAVSFEYFGLNFAMNIQTSNTVGTLDYTGFPGCGGTCKATTALGGSPSVSAKVNEVVFDNTSGGVVQAKLGYYVAYINSAGSYDVHLHATHGMSAPDGVTAVSTYLGFGQANTNTTFFNNFATKDFEGADCLNGCPAPGFAVATGNFAADHLVSMEANTLYFIEMDILMTPQASNTDITAFIDPTFSTGATGGSFIFSPGVTSAVTPLPASLPLLVSGIGGLGFLGWRRQRSV